jgi:hypothetical protein
MKFENGEHFQKALHITDELLHAYLSSAPRRTDEGENFHRETLPEIYSMLEKGDNPEPYLPFFISYIRGGVDSKNNIKKFLRNFPKYHSGLIESQGYPEPPQKKPDVLEVEMS